MMIVVLQACDDDSGSTGNVLSSACPVPVTHSNERYWHTEHVQQWAILTHGTRAAVNDTDTRNTCSKERYWHTEHVQQRAILTHGTRAAMSDTDTPGTRAAMSDTDTRNTCSKERYWHTEHVQPTEKETLLAIYLLEPPRAQYFPSMILWRPVSTKMKRRRRKETNRFCQFF